jgi:hypothetical protein
MMVAYGCRSGISGEMDPERRDLRSEGYLMSTQKIRVGTKRFILSPSQDVGDLKRQIVEAVVAGGAFVPVLAAGDQFVSVLVTPHSVVYIEETEGYSDRTGEVGEFVSAGFGPDEPLALYEALRV